MNRQTIQTSQQHRRQQHRPARSQTDHEPASTGVSQFPKLGPAANEVNKVDEQRRPSTRASQAQTGMKFQVSSVVQMAETSETPGKAAYNLNELCDALVFKTGLTGSWVLEQIEMDDALLARTPSSDPPPLIQPDDWINEWATRHPREIMSGATKNQLTTLYHAYTAFLIQHGLGDVRD
jgi:hypothetical protein